MTKAAAPMIGGISCPPVEATASTAPAKAGRLAGPPHQRNREGLRSSSDIGDGTARDGTEQGRGDDRHPPPPPPPFAGPPEVWPASARAEIHEELPGSRALDEGTEQDEQHHIGGRDIKRDAENALGGQIGAGRA